MGTPGARLQGPFVNGSAAALVSEVPMPVPTAPARATPRPSTARRSSKPLPATESGGATALASLRPLRLIMICLPWQLARAHRAGLCPDVSFAVTPSPILRRRRAAINRLLMRRQRPRLTFAVNMLVNSDAGDTFSLDEIRRSLH